MDYLRSDMKTSIRGTKNVGSGGRSLCLPIPDPCAHTFFPFVLKYYGLNKMRVNIHIYISDPWSRCNVQFRSSLKPHDRPHFLITWSDRDIPIINNRTIDYSPTSYLSKHILSSFSFLFVFSNPQILCFGWLSPRLPVSILSTATTTPSKKNHCK